MKILVTGCYGFIASHLIKYLLRSTKHDVIGVGRYSSAKNISRLVSCSDNSKLSIINGNVQDVMGEACEGVEVIFHLAAKTFVDHSIRDYKPFVHDIVGGTLSVLEAARQNNVRKVIIQSTDEVYGQILEGAYKEDARLNPRNPYAAAKAAADMFALSFHNTYNMDITIARLENVYGMYQNAQKVIPNFVKRAMNNKFLPVYGDGGHVRQWIHVDDNISGLMLLMEKGKSGEIYHIAGNQELTNLELAKLILNRLERHINLITFIEDHNIRPGHDRRYALNSDKIRALGWAPKWDLINGINAVVSDYKTAFDKCWW